jgi:UDP-GlcNAc3NAcA epimerase
VPKILNILTVVGARPQFIKAAMVSRAFASANRETGNRLFNEAIIHTGQHFDDNMSRVFFEQLELPRPVRQFDLGGGPHGLMTGRMLSALEEEMVTRQPDLVLVYGDTNSTLAGALAAAKLNIPVAHVEAGLRSFNRAMPEEINRVLTDHLSTRLFCPTSLAVNNLAREGIMNGVAWVGDVMYDAALFFASRARTESLILERLNLTEKEFFLVTIHRQENTDQPERLQRLLSALDTLSATCPVVWPVHPRLKTRLAADWYDVGGGGIFMIEPLPFLDMMRLEMAARVILTDSGGVQKEAFFHQTPCVTLREETEWVETVEAGWNQLAGTDPERILESVLTAGPGRPMHEYGDGRAADKIVLELRL